MYVNTEYQCLCTCFVDYCSDNIYYCTAWTGGARSTESQFIWSTIGNVITFTQWSWTNPNNMNGNQDCFEMFAASGEWNDRSCDYNTNFICEKNLN